jgi:hypothetical protein
LSPLHVRLLSSAPSTGAQRQWPPQPPRPGPS